MAYEQRRHRHSHGGTHAPRVYQTTASDNQYVAFVADQPLPAPALTYPPSQPSNAAGTALPIGSNSFLQQDSGGYVVDDRQDFSNAQAYPGSQAYVDDQHGASGQAYDDASVVPYQGSQDGHDEEEMDDDNKEDDTMMRDDKPSKRTNAFVKTTKRSHSRRDKYAKDPEKAQKKHVKKVAKKIQNALDKLPPS